MRWLIQNLLLVTFGGVNKTLISNRTHIKSSRGNADAFYPNRAFGYMHRAPVGPKKGRRVLKHHQTTFYEGRNKNQKIMVASIFDA